MSPTTAPSGLTIEADGRHRLAGVRCTACGTFGFPAQLACARCGSATEVVALPDDGTVWSCTVQRLAPKAPFVSEGEYEPFAVAYVDLGPVKVEARLAGRPADSWQIGDPVHLVVGDAVGPLPFWFEGGAS